MPHLIIIDQCIALPNPPEANMFLRLIIVAGILVIRYPDNLIGFACWIGHCNKKKHLYIPVHVTILQPHFWSPIRQDWDLITIKAHVVPCKRYGIQNERSIVYHDDHLSYPNFWMGMVQQFPMRFTIITTLIMIMTMGIEIFYLANHSFPDFSDHYLFKSDRLCIHLIDNIDLLLW